MAEVHSISSGDILSSETLISAGLAESGLSYLFPYQRLVITNILEAARSAGIPFINLEQTLPQIIDIALQDESEGEFHIDGVPPDSDQEVWSGYGRQIVILPTGAGKSLCFQLPARLIDRPTLVIFPILALMADQERRLRAQGSRVVVLRGSQTTEEREAIASVLRLPSNTLIIANPEVLKTRQVRDMLGQARIGHVVIDEAHCVSQWGESFRPAYLELGEILAELKPPLLTAFTATASPEVLEKIGRYIFNDGDVHIVMGNPDRPNISYRLVRTLAKEAALRQLLATLPRPAIVFCGSRSRTEQLARALRYALHSREIYFYHAGLEREEKKTVEEWFFKSSTGILVATCAYGMGVDKADIRTVIHFDCPNLVEAYLQESGRGGRDGKPATATLLWGPEDEERTGPLAEYGRNRDRCRRELLLTLLTGGRGSRTELTGTVGAVGAGGTAGAVCTAGAVGGTETVGAAGLPGDALNGTSRTEAEMIEPATYTGAGMSEPVTCTGDEHSCDICSGTAKHFWREKPGITRLIQQNPRYFTLAEAASHLASQPALDLSRDEGRQILLSLIEEGTIRESRCPLQRKGLVATG
ncbi:MAG TPA: RecQ family ATP-dependent DNA helicase [Treponema sp.]|nr:RecQ family ATP-dependent DNA helicase [Treponema sp.]